MGSWLDVKIKIFYFFIFLKLNKLQVEELTELKKILIKELIQRFHSDDYKWVNFRQIILVMFIIGLIFTLGQRPSFFSYIKINVIYYFFKLIILKKKIDFTF